MSRPARRDPLPAVPSAPDRTFVYIVQIHSFVKIGFASNLYVRISNMQVDSPYPVTVISHYEVAKELARRIEKYTHVGFAEHRVSGEWFAISPQDAQDMVARMIGFIGEIAATQAARFAAADAAAESPPGNSR